MLFSEMKTDFSNVIRDYGAPVRFRYFSRSGASGTYDDDVVLTAGSPDVWTSGLWQPFGRSSDPFHKEQGRVLEDDTTLYTYSTINTSGIWRVGLGSPIGREYASIPDGMEEWEVQGNSVLKRLRLRVLTTNGSLYGE